MPNEEFKKGTKIIIILDQNNKPTAYRYVSPTDRACIAMDAVGRPVACGVDTPTDRAFIARDASGKPVAASLGVWEGRYIVQYYVDFCTREWDGVPHVWVLVDSPKPFGGDGPYRVRAMRYTDTTPVRYFNRDLPTNPNPLGQWILWSQVTTTIEGVGLGTMSFAQYMLDIFDAAIPANATPFATEAGREAFFADPDTPRPPVGRLITVDASVEDTGWQICTASTVDPSRLSWVDTGDTYTPDGEFLGLITGAPSLKLIEAGTYTAPGTWYGDTPPPVEGDAYNDSGMLVEYHDGEEAWVDIGNIYPTLDAAYSGGDGRPFLSSAFVGEYPFDWYDYADHEHDFAFVDAGTYTAPGTWYGDTPPPVEGDAYNDSGMLVEYHDGEEAWVDIGNIYPTLDAAYSGGDSRPSLSSAFVGEYPFDWYDYADLAAGDAVVDISQGHPPRVLEYGGGGWGSKGDAWVADTGALPSQIGGGYDIGTMAYVGTPPMAIYEAVEYIGIEWGRFTGLRADSRAPVFREPGGTELFVKTDIVPDTGFEQWSETCPPHFGLCCPNDDRFSDGFVLRLTVGSGPEAEIIEGEFYRHLNSDEWFRSAQPTWPPRSIIRNQLLHPFEISTGNFERCRWYAALSDRCQYVEISPHGISGIASAVSETGLVFVSSDSLGPMYMSIDIDMEVSPCLWDEEQPCYDPYPPDQGGIPCAVDVFFALIRLSPGWQNHWVFQADKQLDPWFGRVAELPEQNTVYTYSDEWIPPDATPGDPIPTDEPNPPHDGDFWIDGDVLKIYATSTWEPLGYVGFDLAHLQSVTPVGTYPEYAYGYVGDVWPLERYETSAYIADGSHCAHDPGPPVNELRLYRWVTDTGWTEPWQASYHWPIVRFDDDQENPQKQDLRYSLSDDYVFGEQLYWLSEDMEYPATVPVTDVVSAAIYLGRPEYAVNLRYENITEAVVEFL